MSSFKAIGEHTGWGLPYETERKKWQIDLVELFNFVEYLKKHTRFIIDMWNKPN